MKATIKNYFVVADSSFLINLIHADLLGRLNSFSDFTFFAPDHVVNEITYPEQQEALQKVIENGVLQVTSILDTVELRAYVENKRFMGDGEASCLAIAENRGWNLASDEKRSFRRISIEKLGSGRLLNTPGLIVYAIRKEIISVEEADRIKDVLAKNRFKMNFDSFRDLLKREDS